MIAELVKFRIPAGTSRHDMLLAARETVPGWQRNPNLLRKHFLLDDEGYSYGFYLWKSREAAQLAHGDEFKARIRERFGSEPTFTYLDVLLNMDNLTGEVVENLGSGA
jgi:hypothetical protein